MNIAPYPTKQFAYTIDESCRILRTSRTTLYRLETAGKIKISKVGGRKLITHKEIERVVEEGA